MKSDRVPATTKLPTIQKAARKLSMAPRFDFGWNSAKYDHVTGMLPPTLQQKHFITKIR